MSIYLYFSEFDKTNNLIYCPIESCIVMALLEYTKSRDKVGVIFWKCHKSNSNIIVSLKDFVFTIAESLDAPMKLCHLPVYYDGEFYCVSGLCSVLREVRFESWNVIIEKNLLRNSQIISLGRG